MGGAGLVFTEMTDVSPAGRISPGCTGMYKSEHVPAWKRIVDFVHAHSQAKIGLQLGHAGRKGSTRLAWEGMDEPLPERSEEHTSELQSRLHLVCRLLLEKKKKTQLAAFAPEGR